MPRSHPSTLHLCNWHSLILFSTSCGETVYHVSCLIHASHVSNETQFTFSLPPPPPPPRYGENWKTPYYKAFTNGKWSKNEAVAKEAKKQLTDHNKAQKAAEKGDRSLIDGSAKASASADVSASSSDDAAAADATKEKPKKKTGKKKKAVTELEALTPVGGDPAPAPAVEAVEDAPVEEPKKTKKKRHSKKVAKPVKEEDAPDRTLQDSDRAELKPKKTTTQKRKLLDALRR